MIRLAAQPARPKRSPGDAPGLTLWFKVSIARSKVVAVFLRKLERDLAGKIDHIFGLNIKVQILLAVFILYSTRLHDSIG